jgi:hypothetical protein
MSDVDDTVVRVAPTFTFPENPTGLSDERWDEYRALFRKLGSSNGICRYEKEHPGVVYVLYSDQGLAVGGSSKGYAYSPYPLEPTYESLDRSPTDLASNDYAYKRIDDHWYIFYTWDD